MKVAVIGAGFSGMLAAYLLEKQGVEVTIFEKNEYIGGHCKTLVSKDVFSDIGTAFSFTRNIKQLLIELDIDYTEQFVYKKFIDKRNNQVEQLSKLEVEKLLIELRIVEDIYKKYAQSLNQINYSLIPPELLLSYSEFCKKNEIINVAKIIEPFLSSFGFGSVKNVKAYYVFKIFNLDLINAYINGSKLIFFKKGTAQLIKRLSRNISDIRYSMEVKEIEETSNIVKVKTEYSSDSFDKVLISCKLPEEAISDIIYKKFMKDLKTNIYYTITFEVNSNDSVSTYYKSNMGAINKLQFFHIIRKSNRTILVSYAYGNSNKIEIDGIIKDIESQGINIKRVLTVKKWDIFPHFDELPEDIYEKIHLRGNKSKISLIGSLISEPSIDNLYLSVKKSIEKLIN